MQNSRSSESESEWPEINLGEEIAENSENDEDERLAVVIAEFLLGKQEFKNLSLKYNISQLFNKVSLIDNNVISDLKSNMLSSTSTSTSILGYSEQKFKSDSYFWLEVAEEMSVQFKYREAQILIILLLNVRQDNEESSENREFLSDLTDDNLFRCIYHEAKPSLFEKEDLIRFVTEYVPKKINNIDSTQDFEKLANLLREIRILTFELDDTSFIISSAEKCLNTKRTNWTIINTSSQTSSNNHLSQISNFFQQYHGTHVYLNVPQEILATITDESTFFTANTRKEEDSDSEFELPFALEINTLTN